MKIIISPEKQMRVDTDAFACEALPVFMDRTEVLMNRIRSMSYPASDVKRRSSKDTASAGMDLCRFWMQ